MDDQFSHPALHHLQITFEPAEHEAILRQHTRVSTFNYLEAGEAYWGKLPSYVIARCPICGAPYTALLDTHGLRCGWNTHPDFHQSVYSEEHQHIGCAHFVAVQKCVNLNGLISTELIYFANKLDVPFVMPVFLPDDIAAYAVIHSLPICHIEHERFVPRYTAYFMTYYSADPTTLWKRRMDEETDKAASDPEYRMPMLYPSFYARSQPELWDLALWAKRNKLQWLDPTAHDLPLKAAPPEELPYTNVQGYRRAFTLRKGKLELQL